MQGTPPDPTPTPTPAPPPGPGTNPPEGGSNPPGNGSTPPVAGGSALPDLTVPQYLAFAAFLVVVILGVLHETRVDPAEFREVRKLAIFLIGALLPSDAVIRFGRSLFLKAARVKAIEAAEKAEGSDDPADQFVATTTAQILAFATFCIISLLTLLNDPLIDTPKGHDVVKVAVFLIAALLPSEAGIRFGRSLYLRSAPTVHPAQLKKI
jgi:hypothetical protein